MLSTTASAAPPLVETSTDVPPGSFAILDDLLCPICVFDLQSLTMVWANQAAVHFCKCESRSALLARPFTDLSFKELGPVHLLMDQIRSGESWTGHWMSGSHSLTSDIQCQISPFKLQNGRLTILVQGQAPELATPLDSVRSLEVFRNTSVMMTLVRLDGTLLVCNEKAQHTYGTGTEHRTFFERFADTKVGIGLLEQVRRGESFSEEVQVNTAAGSTWHHVDAAPSTDPSSDQTIVLIHEWNTAEVHRADQAVLESRRFLANMSHEIRTPLTAIIGYTELIWEEVEELGLRHIGADLDKIGIAARHLLDLINSVLDLSKVEAGKMELMYEPVDVYEVVDEIVATIGPLSAQNGNALHLDCPEEIGFMRTDKRKLRQVLLNLLGNACKFCENGTIRLVVRREVDASQSWLAFTISDTGIGIAPNRLHNLFDAFVQGENPKQTVGTGLGLAISRQLCRMMGGDITAESTLGEGSTFTVHLPTQGQG